MDDRMRKRIQVDQANGSRAVGRLVVRLFQTPLLGRHIGKFCGRAVQDLSTRLDVGRQILENT